MPELLYAIIIFGIVAWLFSAGLMHKKEDWSYGTTSHTAKESRESGKMIFAAIFLGLLFLFAVGRK